jgi:chemotaxis protein methyltransferase CheR
VALSVAPSVSRDHFEGYAAAIDLCTGDDVRLEAVEIGLLLEAIYRLHGFDFRQYAPGSIRRRIWHRALAEGLRSISGLQEAALHDPRCMGRLLADLSIRTTSMFRDPGFYRAIRSKVVPTLRASPFIRVWNAGCSTGEETYSIAILLREEGLLDRARIYGTDMNEAVLERARSGRLPIGKMEQYSANYLAAGGTRGFSEYVTMAEGVAHLDPSLAANLIFAQHNLVSDCSFNEFDLILCRNVLIYFDAPLQEQVHRLLYDSLGTHGILALGQNESLNLVSMAGRYAELDAEQKLFRRVS